MRLRSKVRVPWLTDIKAGTDLGESKGKHSRQKEQMCKKWALQRSSVCLSCWQGPEDQSRVGTSGHVKGLASYRWIPVQVPYKRSWVDEGVVLMLNFRCHWRTSGRKAKVDMEEPRLGGCCGIPHARWLCLELEWGGGVYDVIGAVVLTATLQDLLWMERS